MERAAQDVEQERVDRLYGANGRQKFEERVKKLDQGDIERETGKTGKFLGDFTKQAFQRSTADLGARLQQKGSGRID